MLALDHPAAAVTVFFRGQIFRQLKHVRLDLGRPQGNFRGVAHLLSRQLVDDRLVFSVID